MGDAVALWRARAAFMHEWRTGVHHDLVTVIHKGWQRTIKNKEGRYNGGSGVSSVRVWAGGHESMARIRRVRCVWLLPTSLDLWHGSLLSALLLPSFFRPAFSDALPRALTPSDAA